MAMQSVTPQNGERDRELRVRVYESPGIRLLKDLVVKAFTDNRFNVVRVIAKRIDFTDFDFTRYRNNLKYARFKLMAGREDLSGIRRKFIKTDTKNSSKAKR